MMTKEEQIKLRKKIEDLLFESYDDEYHSYELEFREMLEEIVSKLPKDE